MDIYAGDDFLGLYDQKFHTNICPTSDSYGVMAASNKKIEGNDLSPMLFNFALETASVV